MPGEADLEIEAAVGCGIEGDGTQAAQHDGACSADGLDAGGGGRGVAGDRILIREPEHDRHVGHVSPARLRQRAVEVYLDPDDGVEDAELLPALHRPLGGPPRTEGVGAGGTHADLEDVECADGGQRSALPGYKPNAAPASTSVPSSEDAKPTDSALRRSRKASQAPPPALLCHPPGDSPST